MRKKLGRFPIGIWISLCALLLTMVAWIMQAYSVINWESAVELGLQNSSFSGDDVERTMANKERGEAIADLLWPLPINILAIVGIMRKKLFGFIAALMEFAICIYFPLFYLFQLWHIHLDTALVAIILWGIPSALGIIGLWRNRNYFLTISNNN